MTQSSPQINILDPAVAELMGRAFDAAWAELKSSGSVYAEPYRADDTREKIALKMIELANGGERDAANLVKRALTDLGYLPLAELVVQDDVVASGLPSALAS